MTSREHVEELYHTIKILHELLKDIPAGLNIVVIGPPQFFRLTADAEGHMIDHLCTLYISDGGPIVYSETIPTSPRLAQNIFYLLVNAIQWTGGQAAERMWNTGRDVARWASQESAFLDPNIDYANITDPSSVLTLDQILVALHGAYEDRTRILQALWDPPRVFVPHEYILRNLAKDNVKIAQHLQCLFDIDVRSISRKYGLAVLNLLHDVLDQNLPENDVVQAPEIFSRRAHGLLNSLAVHLDQLPDALNVTNISLLNDHPLKQGGFSDIYHGVWRIGIMGRHQLEVALKVLKKFRNGPGRADHAQLFREALVWRYLRHENIAEFVGVDSVTFESPAMISMWFLEGNIAKYMAQHTPASGYAIGMLCGIISGLDYMHSANVVHGDLCARNILIDHHGRPYLTDFGLTGLIEAEASSSGTSKPIGSTRWMAPELFKAPFQRTTASDIWAFACVCSEVRLVSSRVENSNANSWLVVN
ncbi:kinase-like domain-containing protein [Mycena galopus ATCC 62051]|nr:kinase-like domain-containing protein [Mycena galopus ATCC 62051]